VIDLGIMLLKPVIASEVFDADFEFLRVVFSPFHSADKIGVLGNCVFQSYIARLCSACPTGRPFYDADAS
jgi:hypothetical protein